MLDFVLLGRNPALIAKVLLAQAGHVIAAFSLLKHTTTRWTSRPSLLLSEPNQPLIRCLFALLALMRFAVAMPAYLTSTFGTSRPGIQVDISVAIRLWTPVECGPNPKP